MIKTRARHLLGERRQGWLRRAQSSAASCTRRWSPWGSRGSVRREKRTSHRCATRSGGSRSRTTARSSGSRSTSATRRSRLRATFTALREGDPAEGGGGYGGPVRWLIRPLRAPSTSSSTRVKRVPQGRLLRGRPDRQAFATAAAWRSRQVPLSAPVGVHDEDVAHDRRAWLTNAIFRPSGDQRGCDPPCVSLR